MPTPLHRLGARSSLALLAMLLVGSATLVGPASAATSSDPDGDSLSFWWFQYPEAGTYRGPFALEGSTNIKHIAFTAPKVEKPETVHVILRLTDKGTPALTRYQRVIVTVTP